MNQPNSPLPPRKPSSPFALPEVEFPDEKQLLEKLVEVHEANCHSDEPEAKLLAQDLPQGLDIGLANLATHAWKTRSKMVDASGEPLEEMKRVYRHVEGMFFALRELGIEIKDHTGEAFDYGLPLKVVTTQPTPGLTRERVLETIKPSIYWHQRIIQAGEVVIATPVTTDDAL